MYRKDKEYTGGSRGKAQQYGGEQTLLYKEIIQLL